MHFLIINIQIVHFMSKKSLSRNLLLLRGCLSVNTVTEYSHIKIIVYCQDKVRKATLCCLRHGNAYHNVNAIIIVLSTNRKYRAAPAKCYDCACGIVERLGRCLHRHIFNREIQHLLYQRKNGLSETLIPPFHCGYDYKSIPKW